MRRWRSELRKLNSDATREGLKRSKSMRKKAKVRAVGQIGGPGVGRGWAGGKIRAANDGRSKAEREQVEQQTGQSTR